MKSPARGLMEIPGGRTGMSDVLMKVIGERATLPSAADAIRDAAVDGRPLALKIDGCPELIIRDERSREMLFDLVDRIETIEAIQEGLRDIEEGRTLTLEEFKAEMARRHGLPL